MYFESDANHPYKNFIEYINITEAANLIKDYLKLVSTIEFSNRTIITSDKIIIKNKLTISYIN